MCPIASWESNPGPKQGDYSLPVGLWPVMRILFCIPGNLSVCACVAYAYVAYAHVRMYVYVHMCVCVRVHACVCTCGRGNNSSTKVMNGKHFPLEIITIIIM